ncbi:MAG: hypothetical protein IPP74_05235 [Alphaproteobacteria bacterium]|nr:hypothetical protein [Alphaproteobacteria bacterium]
MVAGKVYKATQAGEAFAAWLGSDSVTAKFVAKFVSNGEKGIEDAANAVGVGGKTASGTGKLIGSVDGLLHSRPKRKDRAIYSLGCRVPQW